MTILRSFGRVIRRIGRDIWKAIAELSLQQGYLSNEFLKGDSAMRGGDANPQEQRRDFTEG